MAETNYKRTVAGSVGAGVGALFNASGRTYYILEHKTTSKYHNAGESQKIIIDQIELGRDSSCQVRYDESFETVSRKHAAIVRDGQNWQLVHLSNSNPTLVNGQPIQGSYYLQSGDEIQLSVGGPRLGFIVPQGKQALTSSIRLTERMNLFRQQALAPYKRALWTLAILFILVVAGLGYWNWNLDQQLKEQKAEAIALQQQASNLTTQIANLESVANKTPEMEAQIAELKKRKAQVITRYETVTKEIEKKDDKIAVEIEDEADMPVATSNAKTTIAQADELSEESKVANDAATDLSGYTPFVYSLKVDNIKISRYKESKETWVDIKHYVANPGIIGNGFLISNGNFVTARQNVEPWIYADELGGEWRKKLAQYRAAGCEIEISYSAYSSNGTAKKLTFTSRDFKRLNDVLEKGTIYIDDDVRKSLKVSGFSNDEIEYMTGHYRPFDKFAEGSVCYAVIYGLANTGIPTSTSTIEGGKSLKIAGYEGATDVHNLTSFRYLTSTTVYKDEKNGTFILQDGNNTAGYLGSPAFVQGEDKGYKCVGIYVGFLLNNPRIVPINRCY